MKNIPLKINTKHIFKLYQKPLEVMSFRHSLDRAFAEKGWQISVVTFEDRKYISVLKIPKHFFHKSSINHCE